MVDHVMDTGSNGPETRFLRMYNTTAKKKQNANRIKTWKEAKEKLLDPLFDSTVTDLIRRFPSRVLRYESSRLCDHRGHSFELFVSFDDLKEN